MLCRDLRIVGSFLIPVICTFRCAYLTNPGFAIAKIGLAETKLGIVPGVGRTQRLTRLADVSKAKDLVFTARALAAPQALEYGTVIQPFIRHVRN